MPDTALERLSDMVFDFDGGTLIGASLEDFLSVSRHAALVRGAVTMMFSDGLERGDPQPMMHAVGRLARLSHRLIWVDAACRRSALPAGDARHGRRAAACSIALVRRQQPCRRWNAWLRRL